MSDTRSRTAPASSVPATLAPAVAAMVTPVLGTDFWPGYLRGFGAAHPVVIDLGGDPTAVVSGVSWSSWGGATAVGHGTATYVAPGQTVAQGSQVAATVVAFGRGLCAGKDAYLFVAWYFPTKGESFDARAAHLDACHGTITE